MTTSSLYAAFLYGVNIPGGRRFTKADVESALRRLQPSITVAGMVGRPDSLLLWSGSPAAEDYMRRTVSEMLACPCVVVEARTLERVVNGALDSIRARGHPAAPPYRVTSDGVEWELCLVLSSDPLPPGDDDEGWLFSPTTNAVAIAVLERRALLAQKRRRTATGGRVMLGAVLIDPWERVLEKNGVTAACLSSRTLNRVTQVVARATALRSPCR